MILVVYNYIKWKLGNGRSNICNVDATARSSTYTWPPFLSTSSDGEKLNPILFLDYTTIPVHTYFSNTRPPKIISRLKIILGQNRITYRNTPKEVYQRSELLHDFSHPSDYQGSAREPLHICINIVASIRHRPFSLLENVYETLLLSDIFKL